jgi:hypothetical protein
MKWVNLYGGEYAYCDETERIVGVITVSQFDGTTHAYYEKKEIGRYVTEDAAKKAVEAKHNDVILN